MVPGAGARCWSVHQDDTRGHEICWNPFVGDGDGGCKAALDPSPPPCTFCRNLSVKPQRLLRVTRPAVRAGYGFPDAVPLDPRIYSRGAARVRMGAFSQKNLRSKKEMDSARVPGSLQRIWEIQENTYHDFNASLEALSKAGVKLDSGMAFKMKRVVVSFSAGY